ncbi:MAG: DUF177 domain-containing protein [Acidimicrobiales bacterium]
MTKNGRGGRFVVGVALLRKHPGTRRELKLAGPIADLEVTNSRVPEGSLVEVDVALESVFGGVVVSGTVSACWEGECGRCLEPATGRFCVDVREVYSEQADPELEYPLSADWLDLEPLAHDACILELPLAPLCRNDCLGLCPECGVNRNNETCTCTARTDPRWAALDSLGGVEALPEWRK